MANNIKYFSAVWTSLLLEITERIKNSNYNEIYYGDLSFHIRGHKKGSQSLNKPLGQIAAELDKIRKKYGIIVPQLNALVVNQLTKKPGNGIPNPTKLDHVWDDINTIGLDGLMQIHKYIGVENTTIYKGKKISISSIKDANCYDGFDPGSKRKQKISPHTRNGCKIHFDICNELKYELEKKGFSILKKLKCKPDLAMKKEKNKIIIEVKPNSTENNLSHALGQLLFYNHSINADKLIIVAPSGYNSALSKDILEEHNIILLSCNQGPPYLTKSTIRRICRPAI